MAKRRGQPVHGWVNLDKPVGMSSAKAVAIVRRVFNAAKAGHGGTLDPLASGVLPIALGEATKTVTYAMEGTKSYAFTVTWGAQTTTDDLEGDVIETSPLRPTQAAITAIIPEFTGDVLQAPPAFSAIKIDGKRAYELAREAVQSSGSVGPDGSADLSVMPEMEPRPIRIGALSLQALTAEEATFHVTCGKGTYIRSLARDMARQLGTVGHVSMLRRLAVGPFTEVSSISLDFLQTLEHSAAAFEHMHPVVSALDDIPAFPISEDEAAKFRHGQTLSITSASAQARFASLQPDVVAIALCGEQPVALVTAKASELRPVRVFNL
jgi:tRNA pseudouridine55 synthase